MDFDKMFGKQHVVKLDSLEVEGEGADKVLDSGVEAAVEAAGGVEEDKAEARIEVDGDEEPEVEAVVGFRR